MSKKINMYVKDNKYLIKKTKNIINSNLLLSKEFHNVIKDLKEKASNKDLKDKLLILDKSLSAIKKICTCSDIGSTNNAFKIIKNNHFEIVSLVIRFDKINYLEEDELEFFNIQSVDDKIPENIKWIKEAKKILEDKNFIDTFDKKLTLNFSNLKKIIDLVLKENQLDYSLYKVMDAEQYNKSKSIENINNFSGYYLLSLEKNAWVSLQRKRSYSVEFKVSFVDNIKDANMFTKNLDLTLQELELNKNTIAVLQVKAFSNNLILPKSAQNIDYSKNQKLQEVQSILEKHMIEKILVEEKPQKLENVASSKKEIKKNNFKI